ncbi:hypothetical protein TIFTF001_026813 [Ficus carica]|uniref:glutaredoxin-dependent peroxiredoxin n=1 Tax=Ficus carica TaxID=3494 RepID=A0AA88IYN9_FICCA|nr:hypothetical protein TIFTF001_026813 [Ficus carica]
MLPMPFYIVFLSISGFSLHHLAPPCLPALFLLLHHSPPTEDGGALFQALLHLLPLPQALPFPQAARILHREIRHNLRHHHRRRQASGVHPLLPRLRRRHPDRHHLGPHKGKKAILFAVPGAFTLTCSQKNLPGFVEKSAELRSKGVDSIPCISVNDAFVLKAWKEDLKIGDEVLIMFDGNGDFTKQSGEEGGRSRAVSEQCLSKPRTVSHGLGAQ